MGRPAKLLDESTAKTVLDALSVGCSIRTACEAAGLGRTTFKVWMLKGKAASDDPTNEPYQAFRAGVKKARAEGEKRALEIIRDAMPTTWTAAAWYLERSNPARWGKVDRLKANVHSTGQPTTVIRVEYSDDPDEINQSLPNESNDMDRMAS